MTERAAKPTDENSAVEAVAGLLAVAAVVIAVVGIAYRPARLTPAAIVITLIAAAMTTRWRTLAATAAVISGFAWLIGMTIAVITSHPIY